MDLYGAQTTGLIAITVPRNSVLIHKKIKYNIILGDAQIYSAKFCILPLTTSYSVMKYMEILIIY
jgi:hypothetical protein